MRAKILINCLNFNLRDEMRAQICANIEKLFHHDLHVSTARLTLEGDYNQRAKIIYKLAIILELRGSEIILCDETEELLPGIATIVDKAEGELLERIELRKQESKPSSQAPRLNTNALAS